MPIPIRVVGFVCLLCLFSGSMMHQVWAQAIAAQNPGSIAKYLQDRGQTAIVTVDEFNDPFIETSINNTDYNIFFYGCTEHENCTSISLRAQRMSAGRASLDVVNGWNRDQRWTKIYAGGLNSVVMEMDFLFLNGPMEADVFGGNLDIWDRSLEQFVRFVDEGAYDFVD